MKSKSSKNVYFLWVAFMLAMSTEALADSFWKTDVDVSWIMQTPKSTFIFSVTPWPTECASTNKYLYVKNGVAGVDVDGIKQLLSLIMSAHVANRKLDIVIDRDLSTTPNTCYVSQVVMK